MVMSEVQMKERETKNTTGEAKTDKQLTESTCVGQVQWHAPCVGGLSKPSWPLVMQGLSSPCSTDGQAGRAQILTQAGLQIRGSVSTSKGLS